MWEHTFYIPAGNQITYREGNWGRFRTLIISVSTGLLLMSDRFLAMTNFNFLATPYEMMQFDVVEWTNSFACHANDAYRDRHNDDE